MITNKVVIVIDALKQSELVTILLYNGAKVAAWDMLEGKFWETQNGEAFIHALDQSKSNCRLMWVDKHDLDAVELGVRSTDIRFGRPDLVIMDFKYFKELRGIK